MAMKLNDVIHAAVVVICTATAVCFIGLCSTLSANEMVSGSGDVRIQAVTFLPPIEIAAANPDREGEMPVQLGGLSDLVVVPSHGQLCFWSITDRGPNGKVETSAGKRRTLLNPNFQPALIEIQVPPSESKKLLQESEGQSEAFVFDVTVQKKLVLRNANGSPVTGRPNGVGNDEPILDPAGKREIPPDHNGIDSEGLVRLNDGTMWVSEEYRPSLLRVSARGEVLSRYVPQGIELPQADCEVRPVLPARYGMRKDNRGLESLSVSPDGSMLWALLQSPLEYPSEKVAEKTGNIRLLAIDIQSGVPVGEYIYRAGDPSHPDFVAGGASPEDVKVCAMSAIDKASVLVIEQSDEGDAKLYRCSFDGATNTLKSDEPLEPIGNLSTVSVVPLQKKLVADLAGLLPRFASDITGGVWQPKPGERVAGLKLEGIAVIDAHRVAIVNDNDFNMDHIEDPAEPERKSCLWIVSLAKPLWDD